MFNFTPALKLYSNARFGRLSSASAADLQRKQLLALVRRAAGTKFGRDHDFSSIRSVDDYQRRVPLRTYDRFWKEYWQPSFPRLDNVTWPGSVPYFAVSSGTSSGTTKYIPLTNEMNRSNSKAGLDLLLLHVRNMPKSAIFAGKSFMLGGSTELIEQAPGIWSGDLSGIAVKTLPWWAKPRYFPDEKLALLKNWEEKIDILARRALEEDIRMISGVPSWLLIFFDKIAELRPESRESISAAFPKLDMIVHGGVNFAPYRDRFVELLRGSRTELREVYPASEGFIAVADRGYGDGMRLSTDHGLFFEFIPLEELESERPTRHWAADLECGVNYALVMTTCAGLWSYVIGDTVKFVDRNPPRLLVTGRTSYYLSAFGEHVIAEEVDDAVSTAAGVLGKNVTDYSVGPLYPATPKELGGHLFVVEFDTEVISSADLTRFREAVDKRLCARNEDYEAHRAGGFGLNPPRVIAVSPGSFAAWMKSRGKLGGQHKVPRIIMGQELFENLKEFAEAVAVTKV